ncbi:hypothetical protein TEA_022726 [Camellia sinensis var. sinensis]|uniref:Uncharacterized protein n=1 Tax=Camellia sinensis var. sinensis TaxID=542762 RepID=A0A4S4F016_CAMSN|nr:hypothetical protein TEA_022726 [Camellia sinensis var. sinensis]
MGKKRKAGVFSSSQNPQSYDTFQQRHLINDTYWGGASNNPPIFVYMGNEADIEWFAQNTGFMFDKAPNFRALLVFIEKYNTRYDMPINTRYEYDIFYKVPILRRSIPFGGDKNIANKNTTQALADYATLIIDLKKNLSAIDSPVVFIGVLAAWFRLKYPHVTIGALASPSPILLFENITSPYAFNNVITQDFQMCKAIDDPTAGNDTYRKFCEAVTVFYNYTGDAGPCFDLADRSDPHGLGGWGWQVTYYSV